VIATVVTTFVGVVAVIAIMDVTILKLPHMQVVLSEQEETDKMDKEREEDKEEEEVMRLRKRRRLDSSGQEISSGSEERVGETMRREPAHRRRNRQKVKKQQMQNGLSSSADEVTALQNEGGMERSKIEELLRKYGFGSWTKPEEVWRGRNISRVSEIPESTNTS